MSQVLCLISRKTVFLANFVRSAATFLPLPPPPIVGKIAKEEGRRNGRWSEGRGGKRERDSLSSALTPPLSAPHFFRRIFPVWGKKVCLFPHFFPFWPMGGGGGRERRKCVSG